MELEKDPRDLRLLTWVTGTEGTRWARLFVKRLSLGRWEH